LVNEELYVKELLVTVSQGLGVGTYNVQAVLNKLYTCGVISIEEKEGIEQINSRGK